MIEHWLIAVGFIGSMGALAALGMAWAAHIKENEERQWWLNRGDNWISERPQIGTSQVESSFDCEEKIRSDKLPPTCVERETIYQSPNAVPEQPRAGHFLRGPGR